MKKPATQPPLYQPDTNILVHYARGDWIQQKMEPTYQLLLTPTIPVISYVIEAEIRSLAVQLGWGEPRTKQLGFILSALQIVHISEPGILDAYVAIDAYSRRQGVDMGKNDLWIAATSNVTGATLLTTDKDFDHLDGLYLTRIWIDPKK